MGCGRNDRPAQQGQGEAACPALCKRSSLVLRLSPYTKCHALQGDASQAALFTRTSNINQKDLHSLIKDDGCVPGHTAAAPGLGPPGPSVGWPLAPA
jgi:hypothetical protein